LWDVHGVPQLVSQHLLPEPYGVIAAPAADTSSAAGSTSSGPLRNCAILAMRGTAVGPLSALWPRSAISRYVTLGCPASRSTRTRDWSTGMVSSRAPWRTNTLVRIRD